MRPCSIAFKKKLTGIDASTLESYQGVQVILDPLIVDCTLLALHLFRCFSSRAVLLASDERKQLSITIASLPIQALGNIGCSHFGNQVALLGRRTHRLQRHKSSTEILPSRVWVGHGPKSSSLLSLLSSREDQICTS